MDSVQALRDGLSLYFTMVTCCLLDVINEPCRHSLQQWSALQPRTLHCRCTGRQSSGANPRHAPKHVISLSGAEAAGSYTHVKIDQEVPGIMRLRMSGFVTVCAEANLILHSTITKVFFSHEKRHVFEFSHTSLCC